MAYMCSIGKAIVLKFLHNRYVLKTIDDLQSNFADVLADATAFVAAVTDAKNMDKCLTFVTVYGFRKPDTKNQHLLPS